MYYSYQSTEKVPNRLYTSTLYTKGLIHYACIFISNVLLLQQLPLIVTRISKNDTLVSLISHVNWRAGWKLLT